MQIILLVGAKLQVIITKLGLRIQERGDVVKGAPVVQPGDDLFWFGRPRFILFLIHLVLFQVFFFIDFSRDHLCIYLFHLNTFNKSSLIYSYLLSFCLSLLFQNAFQLAFFSWSTVSKSYLCSHFRAFATAAEINLCYILIHLMCFSV